MNKVIYLVIGICVLAGVWFAITPSSPQISFTDSNTANPNSGTTASEASSSTNGSDQKGMVSPDAQPVLDDNEEGLYDEQEKPAAEIYASAEAALEAVKKGAKSYDDLILEQFVEPGRDCKWCDSFYSEVRSLVATPGLSADEKSYYSELLAISGRVENIGELINGIESSASEEDSEIFTEALEITVGGDEVVNFLATRLDSAKPELRESMVAAISNQGTARTVETLYDHTVKSNNPDGYYAEGTGLGEVIPDEEAFPLLKKIIAKRDDYSHLGVKALINSGLEGLKNVVDVLNTSPDPERDTKLLADAADHVSYEDETKDYISKVVVNSGNTALAEWGKNVLKDFEEEEGFSEEDEAAFDEEEEVGEE